MQKEKSFVVFVMAILFLTGLLAVATAADDIQTHPNCKYCGMDRQKFAHSRMYIEYDDGSVLAVCSVHCAAIDLALAIDKTPQIIQVADFNTKNLIEAKNALWVLGGNKMGVMTKRAKWAFETKKDAEKFIEQNGGTMATFDEAMKASYEDLYADTKMIREKRKMMKMKKMEKKH
jgi:nitrous oxide reductase accessory protein NosL